MRSFLIFVALLSACSQPAKIVTAPEVGMHLVDFQNLCGGIPDDSKTSTNANGETLILINKPTNYNGEPKIASCVGTFTFVNGKLTTITH
jgi:hypothetical protein